MESNKQMTRAQQQQEKSAAARIVKDIVAIERSYFEACFALSEQFMAKLAEAMRSAAPEPWQVVGNDADVSLLSPDWRSTRGVGRGDAWFEVGEVVDDDNEHSWIAAAVSAVGTCMGLELRLRNGLPGFGAVLVANTGLASQILAKGFEQAESGARLYMPITIDGEALAKAFETGDFTEALAPARTAMERVVAAKPELDALMALVRRRKPH